MKILLIDPPMRRFTGMASFYFPTSLAYLAAPLTKTDHKVVIYDVDRGGEVPKGLNFNNSYRQMQLYVDAINDRENHVWQEVKDVLHKYNPDLVGISAMTTKLASAMKIAELVKGYNSHCYVVMGGPHPTITPDDILESGIVDFVCRGEGERSFLELVNALDCKTSFDPRLHGQRGLSLTIDSQSQQSHPFLNGGQGLICIPQSVLRNLNGIDGISYKENGRIIHNNSANFISDLDSIPYPARDRLLNIEKYSSEDIGVLLTSRGCPYRCSYCYHPFQASRVKYRSIDNIIVEIEEVRRRYGSYQFSIKDDSFTVKRSHVIGFCEALLKNKIRINWDCTTRVNLVDEELLRLMKAAGCNVIKVGVESGSERILRDTNKGITHEQVRKAAKLFNKLGIFWTAYFMVGLPQETKDDMIKTYEFMKEINPFYAGLGVYNPFPNTELFELGVKMGILKEKIGYDDFKAVNPIDYYFIKPDKRVAALSKEEFDRISTWMMAAFDKHNKGFDKLIRRALARRKQYIHDPYMIKSDLSKAVRWIRSG